eukprot:SAG31_NODE_1079_length_10031_cov_5.270741_4_plen_77_part_00
MSLVQVRSYLLVCVPTIREIRDFYREMQRTNRESVYIYRNERYQVPTSRGQARLVRALTIDVGGGVWGKQLRDVQV